MPHQCDRADASRPTRRAVLARAGVTGRSLTRVGASLAQPLLAFEPQALRRIGQYRECLVDLVYSDIALISIYEHHTLHRGPAEYPAQSTDYQLLRDALEKLHLSDAALTYQPESSVALAGGGAAGGGEGARGRNSLNGGEVPGKAALEVEAGDRLLIETPGGGGWGEESADPPSPGTVPRTNP